MLSALTCTDTLIDLGTVRVTRQRQLTQAEKDRYARYLADEILDRHMARLAEADHASDLFRWLGERDAAIPFVKHMGCFELVAIIIGRTAEAVNALAQKYAADHDGKLPRTSEALPWHGGFRASVSRRENI